MTKKQIFLKGLLCMGLVTIFVKPVKSQYNPLQPPILPQAPSTAALGKFGEYPVSHFTGLPNISIPLYTVKTKGFEIPITLSYHASGIKIQQYPSWVGAGWALSAGGQISRQLTGIPDELSGTGALAGEPKKATDIDLNDEADRAYLKLLTEGQRDAGADIFSYSFPGSDGKFFFDRDSGYKIMKLPYSPIKIKNSGSSGQLNFDITDEKGNKYEFGKTYTELSLMSGGNSYYPSSYMLEKMIAAKVKDTVRLTYHSQFERSPLERTDNWTVEDQVNHIAPKSDENYNTLPYPYSASQGTFSSTNFQSETFSENISEIRFKNGKIIFELDGSARQDFNMSGLTNKALKRIKVINTMASGADTLLKTIEFYYDYFTTGSNDSKRLRLDSLKVFDNAGTEISKYKFDYNTATNLPAPGVSQLSKDYWGYYNGRSNSCLVPQTSVSYQPAAGGSTSTITIGSTNSVGREPDSVYVQANILKRIYYPTGGRTEFEYESNRYLEGGSTMKLAGGLRIKTIKSYDSVTSAPVTRLYKYGSGESGYGRKNFFDLQNFYYEEQLVENWDRNGYEIESSNPHLIDKKRIRTYFDNPTAGVESMEGASVVYPVVTEYMDDGTGALGKTIYQYRDSTDGISYSDLYSTRPFISTRFFSRGQLQNKKTYKKLNAGGFVPVAEESYIYNAPSFPYASRFTGLNLKQYIVRTPVDDYNVSFTSNDYYYNNNFVLSDDNYPVSSTSIVFNPDDTTKQVQTVSFTSYKNYRHQQPNTITTINSKGDTVVAEIKYPADFIPSNDSLAHQSVLDTMLNWNMQAYAIELWTRKATSNKVLSGGLNLYRQENGLIVLDNQKRLDIASPITDYTTASVSSGTIQSDSRYKTKVSIPLYDATGNVLEMKNENDIKEIYLWGYNGQFPVARVTGTSYATVSSYITQSILDHPASDYALRNHLSSIRTNLSGIPVSTYTYHSSFGITSETDARGRTLYYVYDKVGRLIVIRDHDNNIIKKFCYNYAGQQEECGCSSLAAQWQNTSTAIRCKLNGSSENTGEQEQEQVDINPCSPAFNTLRWTVVGTNTTACPLPCNIYTCVGEDKKCVSGICETGVKIYTGADYDFGLGVWICYYHYEFSDNSWSSTYSEQSSGACYFD